ncbi:MFS transporter [Kitasatospora sp. NA04385]|uniref:MFS transporter n=1 Tax=Kitasatospora sp. NA04385 TaxID=2742135 RepID=UPI00159097FC|nr:MFS transporter [Kitasatospora sp. NA04385]QKW23633.1 MFS transporter [Kitasatospora sp. NA04385]
MLTRRRPEDRPGDTGGTGEADRPEDPGEAPDRAGARLGRPFRLFQSAVVASDLADGIYKTAVPLLALDITRSALGITLVGLAVRLPWLIAILPAGVAADRHPPRTVMRWASAVRLPVVALLCVLAATDRLTLWALAPAAFLVGCAGSFVDVAAQSQLPRLVATSQLSKANASLQSTQTFLAQLLGPALGGYAAALGAGGGLAASVLLYLVTVWALGLLPSPAPPAPAPAPEPAAPAPQPPAPPAPPGERPARLRALVGELGEGLRHFRGRHDLVRLAATAAANNLAYAMCLTILPLWAVAPGPLGLSTTGYGLLLTCLAVGSIVAGPSSGYVLRKVGERRVMRFGAPLLGLCFLSAGSGSVAVVAAGFLCYGLLSTVWSVAVLSYRQATIPTALFGRVNAAYRWLTWGVIPLGAALAGALATLAGTRWVFVVAGALPVAVGLLLPPVRTVRPEERSTPDTASGGTVTGGTASGGTTTT